MSTYNLRSQDLYPGPHDNTSVFNHDLLSLDETSQDHGPLSSSLEYSFEFLDMLLDAMRTRYNDLSSYDDLQIDETSTELDILIVDMCEYCFYVSSCHPDDFPLDDIDDELDLIIHAMHEQCHKSSNPDEFELLLRDLRPPTEYDILARFDAAQLILHVQPCPATPVVSTPVVPNSVVPDVVSTPVLPTSVFSTPAIPASAQPYSIPSNTNGAKIFPDVVPDDFVIVHRFCSPLKQFLLDELAPHYTINLKDPLKNFIGLLFNRDRIARTITITKPQFEPTGNDKFTLPEGIGTKALTGSFLLLRDLLLGSPPNDKFLRVL